MLSVFVGQDCGKLVDVGSAFGLGCIRKVGFIRWLENWGQSIGGSIGCEAWG